MTADLKAPGANVAQVLQRVAHEDLSGHRAVAFRSDGTVAYADNGAHWCRHLVFGITTGAALAGDSVEIAMSGDMITEPSWSWTPGAPIFLGANGALTQTAPTAGDAEVLVVLGIAISATSMYVDPAQPIVL